MNKWMSSEEAFRVLGIERTGDKRAVKKAYAKLVKQYHPEEYPKEWEKIHDAYEIACRAADLGKAPSEGAKPSGEERPGKPEPSGEGRAGRAEPSREETTGKPGKPEPSGEERPGRAEPSGEKRPRRPETPEEAMAERGELWTEKVISWEEAPSEEEGMKKLFREVERLSKEQLRQNEEERRKALERVLATWKNISTKRKIDKKEWEAFFWDEEILPLISTKEFLYSLGDTLSRRKIDKETCLFLSEQIRRIEQYDRENNITLKNDRADPVGYVKSKIRYAYKAKNTIKDATANISAIGKAFVWFMIIALIFGGILPALSSKTESKQRRNDEQMAKLQEDFLRMKDYVQISELPDGMDDYISENVMCVGDTREKMISIHGEPDIIQESAENEEYEEAVYHQPGGIDLKYILDGDIVVSIRYVYSGEN